MGLKNAPALTHLPQHAFCSPFARLTSFGDVTRYIDGKRERRKHGTDSITSTADARGKNNGILNDH